MHNEGDVASDLVRDLERQLSAIARTTRMPSVLPDGTVVQRSTISLLYLLGERRPVRNGEVATVLGLNPSTTTRQIVYAEDLGLIRRTTDPTDKRASLLDLTTEGEKVLRAVTQQQREGLELVMGQWSEQDRNDIVRLLTQFNTTVAELRQDRNDPADPPTFVT